MRSFIERYSFLMLLLIVIAGSFYFAYYVWAYEEGTDFTLCTDNVDQPSCYSSAYPTPKVEWTVDGSSSHTDYEVEIDDDDNFDDPEIDTGWVDSSNENYEVDQEGLSFGATYYWRVRVEDEYGSISEWVEDDSSFVVSDSCSSDPTATDLSVTSGDYCSTPSHYFSWTYSDGDDDDQERFEFQVDDNSDFGSPEVDRDYEDLSNPSPTTNNQTVTVAESPGSDQIGYNNTYYWRVKVYDEEGDDSGWVSGSSFTTGLHQYPTIDFSWSPENPSQDEDVLFTDQSTVYGGASKSSWSWTFEDGDPSSSSDQNPTVQFTSNGEKEVTLDVTDSDGLSCDNVSDPQTVGVQIPLPEWKEVTPH